MCLSLDYFLHFVSFTVASSSNTSSTDPKDSQYGTIVGFIVGVVVFCFLLGYFCFKKGMSKGSIATVDENKKQVYTEEKEVRLSSSSDIGGNANNAPSSSRMVNNNKVSPAYQMMSDNKIFPTYQMMNDNKVSPTYNDYVVYALPRVYKVMPHRPVFVGEWEHKYFL